MKITTYILLPIVAAAAMSVSATTYEFVAANDRISTKLCVAAANNNLIRYKQIAAGTWLTPTFIANKMTCNDQNIVNFSSRYNAMKTAEYINKDRKHRVTITDMASAAPQQDNSDEVVIITVN